MSSEIRVLPSVEGVDDRKNDVLLLSRGESAKRSLIYFGGDVQDYSDRMEAHRDNHRYARQWSLERTARRLADAVADANVIIVKPAKMDLGTFSIYSNLVHFENEFTPVHNDDHRAVNHLKSLLLSLQSSQTDFDAGLPKVLIGFSKGVVVLNQLLHEFHSSPLLRCGDFAGSISKMVWLDGGHNGGKETWVTNADILDTFCSMGIGVDVRVTPYQISDSRRPWIKSEEKRFSGILKRSLSCENFQRRLFFADQEACIDNHFNVLATLNEYPI